MTNVKGSEQPDAGDWAVAGQASRETPGRTLGPGDHKARLRFTNLPAGGSAKSACTRT